jgi:ethanolamine utilization protein EutL
MSLLTRTAAVVKALRVLPAAAPELARALGVRDGLSSLALVTCDQDDPLYAALDHATKMAEVEVTFARSFYAGSRHASGPWSGEIMGVLAARDSDIIAAGVRALRTALDELYAFYTIGDTGVSVFPTVIPSVGRYLSRELRVSVGAAVGYFVAPPLESMIGMDAAIKAARVEVCRIDPPPSPTNFAAGYVTGSLDAVQAAATAFRDAVVEVAREPVR